MYQNENPETIQSMFNNIAEKYDTTNAILSFNLHKCWNHTLVSHVVQKKADHIYLDLCSGTGDIAFDYLNTVEVPCKAYMVDFSTEMLAIAKNKSLNRSLHQHQVTYLEADVLHLPLPNEIADCATMAYGIRNVKDPVQCLKEAYRVLKPGGCFGILELTRPQNPLLHLGHHIYLKGFLPILGKFLTNNQDAYRYLQMSIDRFIAPAELEKLMVSEGFIHTKRVSLTGGIATILIGYR